MNHGKVLDYGIVRATVHYLYTGTMDLIWDIAEQILQACDFLQLKNLKQECVEYIQNFIITRERERTMQTKSLGFGKTTMIFII